MSGGLMFIVEIADAIQTGIKIGAKLDGSGDDPTAGLGEAVSAAFDNALGAASNEGQISQIESIGQGGFMEATMEAKGQGTADALMGMCPHPEAVDEILADAGDELDNAYNDAMDNLSAAGSDDE